MGSEVDKQVYLAADYMVTANGFGTAVNREAILNGDSGIKWVDDEKIAPAPLYAGLIDKDKLKEKTEKLGGLENFTLLEQLFMVCISEVLSQAGLCREQLNRCGLIISTTKGNIGFLEEGVGVCEDIFMAHTAGKIAGYFKFPQPPVVISNACISGVSAVIAGARLIREGKYQHVLVAGGDVLNRFVVSGFQSLKSVSEQICRPFDADRNGLSLGEGCAATLLTADKELAASGMNVAIAGGGLSNDANHISGPSRTGDGLAAAIQAAAAEAGISVHEIGFINSHGTATVYNDEMESKAYALAGFGAVAVNGLKHYLGHTLGASGVIETILSAYQLREQRMYATQGFENSGVSNKQLNIAATHTKLNTSFGLKTASGFGGCNAALVLGLPEKVSKSSVERVDNDFEIVASQIYSSADGPFDEFIRAEYKTLEEPNLKFFKMDRLAKLGYVASCKLVSKVRSSGVEIPENTAVILASGAGSLDTDLKHWNTVVCDETGNASPALFVYTLANVVAGEICIKHKLKGEQTTFICNDEAQDVSGKYAELLLKRGWADAVLYGWCELLEENYHVDMKWMKAK